MSDNEREWVIAPDAAKIDIAIGPDAQLSDDVRAALDQLAEVLGEQSEVQGYAMCGSVEACVKVTVTNCGWLITCSEVYR